MQHVTFLKAYERLNGSSPLPLIKGWRNWLVANVPICSDTFAAYDSGELCERAAGVRIAREVMEAFRKAAAVPATTITAKRQGGSEPRPKNVKRYCATAFYSQGEQETMEHDTPSAAARWCAKRVADGPPGSHGEVMCRHDGITTKIDRERAIAAVYGGRAPSPVLAPRPSKGFDGKAKCSQTKVTHSHG